jgi:hypothetical protein
MSYRLGLTEEDTEVKKVVDEAQAYYDVQEKREWVEWAGKTLMPHLHAQMAMEKVDVVRVEQEELEEMRRQDKREQQEWEWAELEAELDEKQVEYIRQMNAKGKTAPTRAKVYGVVEGPVSLLVKSLSSCANTNTYSATNA